MSEVIGIEGRVKAILARQFVVNGLSAPEISRDHLLRRDLGFDSLDIVEITMGIEDEFGLDIDDSEMGTFLTVQSVCDYVLSNVRI